MARSVAARRTAEHDELDAVEAFYRRRLTAKAQIEAYRWEPVRIGPTWQRDGEHWLLPERSLGWAMLAWSGVFLQAAANDPWVFTDEQARFLLWWYAVDESGRFLYRDGVLQRLKGHGKDPIGGAIGMNELVGPCVVVDMVDGQPVGGPHPDPWVQVAAVSLEQTKNTMRLLPTMVSPRARREYDLMIGKESAYSGNRFLQAVTSSPATLQGARASFVLLNETHEWISSNGGHDMAYVLQNNATKSKGGSARTLRITNAYEPGLDSVAERDREAWQAVESGRSESTGLLYDSLEAAPEAPLSVEAAPEVVRSVRGDSTWLDVDRIVASINDPRNAPSQSRRFWYNQIVAAEDAWADPNDVKRAAVKDVDFEPGDAIVVFGDGSKSDDATGLVAVRMSDGLAKVLHVQQPKAGKIVNRDAVDLAVKDAEATYTVLAFWFDPSHAKDDEAEGDNRFWWPLCDEWMERYGRRFKLWPVQSGPRRHAVAFDMSLPSHQALFVPAVEQCLNDFEDGTLRFVASAWLEEHCINARRLPNRYGVTVRKEHRESHRKIDLAVCLIGARMLWRQMRLTKKSGTPGKGRVIILPD